MGGWEKIAGTSRRTGLLLAAVHRMALRANIDALQIRKPRLDPQPSMRNGTIPLHSVPRNSKGVPTPVYHVQFVQFV
jgi:hypothetical protein